MRVATAQGVCFLTALLLVVDPADAQGFGFLGRLLGGGQEPAKYAPSAPQKAQPLLVRITYPARVDPASRAALAAQYKDRAVTIGECEKNCEPFAEAFDQAIAKTNYFAWFVFQDLAKRLPPGTVILQPALLSMRGGAAVCDVESRDVPSVLDVDMFFYVQPRRDSETSIPTASSFGPMLRPVVEIRTDAAAAPATGGLLASTAELARLPVAGEARQAPCTLAAVINSTAKPVSGRFQNVRNSRPAAVDSHYQFAFSDLEISRDDWGKLASPQTADGATLPVLNGVGDVVVDLLNALDHEKAATLARNRYAALFDEKLSSADLSPEHRDARHKVLFEFEKLEVEFLRLAQAPLDRLNKGDFGKLVRSLVDVEWGHYDKMKGNQRTQTVTTGLALLGAFMAGRTGQDASGFTEILVKSIADFDAQRTAASSALSDALAPLGTEQNRVLVEFSQGHEKMEAASLRELRPKLLAKYRELFDKQ